MGLVSKAGAERLRKEVQAQRFSLVTSGREQDLREGIVAHFNALHSLSFWPDREIEQQLLDDEQKDVDALDGDIGLTEGVVMFSPSSASKCPRELFFKATKAKKDDITMFPYQKRWTRNSTAVHRAVQKDLLYAEKVLTNPLFTVERTEDGRPAWERNIAHVVQFEHNGVRFQMYGMMDGILRYTPDGSRIGFEFKTKSTTIAAVGDFKMREPSQDHVTQCTAYSLLFGIDEYLITYESVAKDGWMKGADARADMKSFYIRVTDDDRNALLDKFAFVAENFYNGEIPDPDFSKCIFCPYKTRCKEATA
ncbi:PD-(D/E)XK nuclease family protein [Paenibacillus sp. 1P03SA]|uniref:PD-(D/E)XK nuclease family protein n=1 Tax=Paenibacillus sp. 1P03SA TaxID=3132294 RepID=UPI0039A10213